MAYLCSLCDARSPSVTLWMSHVRLVHQFDSGISLSCPVHGCSAVYSKVNSICSHIYRQHKDATGSCEVLHRAEPAQESTSSGILMDLSLPPALSHDIHQLLHTDVYEQQKKSCLFLLQMKEERLLTQAAVNDVVIGCREVFEHTISRIRAGVSQKLAQCGIDPSSIDGLDNIFNEAVDPFTGLETAYLQDKFISKELGCVVSMYM